MKARIVFTLFCLTLGLGAVWDAWASQAPTHVIVKGLAQDDWSHNEDRAALGVASWYAWGDSGCADPCINMNRNWTPPQANCYSVLLLGNEPNVDEPSGHPIAPSVAASVTVTIKSACPSTRIVATNIYMDLCGTVDWPSLPCPVEWLKQYFAAYKQMSGKDYGLTPNPDGRYDALGVHFYCNDLTFPEGIELPAPCSDALRTLHASFPALPALWVTETGVLTDYNWAPWLTALALDRSIERVYAFTNRWVDVGGSTLDLVSSTGALTARGQAFHDWQAVSYALWFPNAGAAQGYP